MIPLQLCLSVFCFLPYTSCRSPPSVPVLLLFSSHTLRCHLSSMCASHLSSCDHTYPWICFYIDLCISLKFSIQLWYFLGTSAVNLPLLYRNLLGTPKSYILYSYSLPPSAFSSLYLSPPLFSGLASNPWGISYHWLLFPLTLYICSCQRTLSTLS